MILFLESNERRIDLNLRNYRGIINLIQTLDVMWREWMSKTEIYYIFTLYIFTAMGDTCKSTLLYTISQKCGKAGKKCLSNMALKTADEVFGWCFVFILKIWKLFRQEVRSIFWILLRLVKYILISTLILLILLIDCCN